MSYTLAITSCGRHELLRRTLESFVSCITQNPTETIIFEDGPDAAPEWIKEFGTRLGKLKWITGGQRRGQAYAIDRLYSEIKTEWIFWCEDDWEFHESAFLPKSFKILNDNPDIVLVALRSDWNHPLVRDPRGFDVAEPGWGGCWGGFTFNPGLRRLSDYKRFGSYGRHVGYGTKGLGHEAHWSKMHLDAGFRIAVLPAHCRHIGGGCSRAVEDLPALPRILIAVPACQNFEYGKWESEKSPRYSGNNPAYGLDIHISGPNPRTDAVRATWWNDISKHANVEARFFYGRDFSGTPGRDEVILPCDSDYASLPHRTREICKWAIAEGYHWVLKVDDDSYVRIDAAIREVLNGEVRDYGGYNNCNICTGGPGYWLSRRAMEAVAGAQDITHWAEDCFVGKVMGEHNINPDSLPGHIPGFSNHWVDIEALPAEFTVAHAVKPTDMIALHQKLNRI